MPFIDSEHRIAPDTNIPGDRCYLQYKELIDMWRKEPRWSIIDKFAKRIWEDDTVRAAGLALLVFMFEHGMDYERKKKKEHGDI